MTLARLTFLRKYTRIAKISFHVYRSPERRRHTINKRLSLVIIVTHYMLYAFARKTHVKLFSLSRYLFSAYAYLPTTVQAVKSYIFDRKIKLFNLKFIEIIRNVAF